MHTHSRYAVAAAQAGLDLPCYGTTHADYFYGAVPCARELTAEEIENFLMVCIRGLVYDWCICDGGYDLKEKMKMYVDALLMPFCTDPRQ